MAQTHDEQARVNPQASDGDQLSARFESWFAQRFPAATHVAVTGVDRFTAGGMSCETVGLDLTWTEGNEIRSQRLVLRLAPPSGEGVFATYEMANQGRIQEILDDAGLPVVRPIAAEDDPSILGSPFVVMPFVQGRIPTDNPPFPLVGWVAELDQSSRHRLASSVIDVMADIHSLDWREHGLTFAARAGGPGMAGEIEWWDDYLAWAEHNASPEDFAAVSAIMAWCKEHRPENEPPSSLVWGDARLGNVIFGADLEVTAVLDWELATVGPAELDLGWYFAYRHLLCSMLGLPGLPELSGFPDVEAELDRYERRLGRPVQDLEWHTVFAAVRIAACQMRVRQAVRHLSKTGQLEPEFVKLMEAPLIQDWVHEAMTKVTTSW